MRGSLSRVMLLAAAGVVMASAANAASLDITGFVRAEPAVKITDDENPNSQYGNEMNGRTVVRDTRTLALGGISGLTGVPVPVPAVPTPFSSLDTNTRTAPDGKTDADNEFNNFTGRAEVDFTVNVSEQVTLFTKVRAMVAPNVHDQFGDEDYFNSDLFSGTRGTFLEVSGDNYMIDLPQMYIDYNNGPLWLRAGNQTIAWGESYFFRVLDVPNGLDLRRHSVLDVGAEEFSDKRVPAPAIRGSYRVTETIEAEAFVQMFSPTVLSTQNSPYSVVGDEFVLHEDEFNDDRWAANVGGRVQAAFGDLGLQAIAVNRRDPNGVVRWTTTRDPGPNTINPGDFGVGGGGFCALLVAAPFACDAAGVSSATGFFHNAGLARLNSTLVGSAALDPTFVSYALGAFAVPSPNPATPVSTPGVPFTPGWLQDPALGATVAGLTPAQQTQQLFDFFFQALGPLRGHVERVYPRENIFGFGANYVVHSENEYLDQLILRTEASITPNKKFTYHLERDFIEEDEIAAAIIAEKYHRFSQAFPATYFVTQYLFKSDSDIFGRHLSGMGGTDTQNPTGVDNSHYFVLALQQPFPSLVWRADLAILYDVQGGAQIQPGVRWKPREQYTMELYANIFESNGGNDDFAQSLDYADEVFLRLGYQF